MTTTRATRSSNLVLTHRDLAVLAFVAASRAVPLDLLAARYFETDPVTGCVNTQPLRVCKRRLSDLARAGYLWLTTFSDGGDRHEVAMLGPHAGGITGVRPERNRVPPRKRAHHVRTLEALADLERKVRARGGRVLRTRLEPELRLEQQGGRFTQRGDVFVACPDAVCTVELPGRDKPLEIAVEYVTGKYTSADIRKKRDEFRNSYDRVLWCADRPGTAKRVHSITGQRCKTLSRKKTAASGAAVGGRHRRGHGNAASGLSTQPRS